MIKKRNNIRFGNEIYIIENFNDTHYLLRNPNTKMINWVPKSLFKSGLKKMNFKSTLNENVNERRFQFNNKYLTVQVNPYKNGSIISILTEDKHWAKYYNYNTSRALYEFNKFFNYYNELTPYKLNKHGFKILKGSN